MQSRAVGAEEPRPPAVDERLFDRLRNRDRGGLPLGVVEEVVFPCKRDDVRGSAGAEMADESEHVTPCRQSAGAA